MPWISSGQEGLNKMSSLLKNLCPYILFRMSENIPWTQGMCNETVHIEPHFSAFIPDYLRTREMCNEAVRREPYTLQYVPDPFITQGMCNEVVHIEARFLAFVPDRFKTQEMRNKAVEEDHCD